MKKKLILFISILFLLVACSMSNTPTSKVEALFSKYQSLDTDISRGIDNILDEQNLTDENRLRYRNLLEKQYKNLSYEITDEKIDGNNATVTVTLDVLDYRSSISDLTFDSTIYTKETFDNEKLNRLENTNNKVTYTLEFTLTKDEEGTWHLNALTNEQIRKIEGMY